jgi:hypothetical protein
MSDSSGDILLGYFPLYGATFDSDEVGWVGGRVAAYVPEPRVWSELEQSDISMERTVANLPWASPLGPYHPSGMEGAPPPICIVIGQDIPDDDRADETISAARGPMSDEAADAILALRLLRSGWFLDPELSMRVFRYEPWIANWRLAGPYRQVGLSDPVEATMPAYELRLEDLVTGPDEAPPLTQLFQLVQEYRANVRGAADIAVRNFGNSYGYMLVGTARAAVLFTALDAMLGGMGARQIGRLRLKSTFAERVEQALRLDPGIAVAWAAAEAEWLDTEGRRLRNALAHGRPSDVADLAEDSHERIRSVVRSILTTFLEFCIEWSSEAALPESALPDPKARTSGPVAAFNAALEA